MVIKRQMWTKRWGYQQLVSVTKEVEKNTEVGEKNTEVDENLSFNF